MQKLRSDVRILLIDNYDSFTYNFVHYLEGFDAAVTVWCGDEVDLEGVAHFDKIVLSPGPGLPSEALQMARVIAHYSDKKPMMGVCLGFQALVEHFGGTLYNQSKVKHGVSEMCHFRTDAQLFRGLPSAFNVGLYHSWAVETANFPKACLPTAISDDGVIMAFEHTDLPVCGVQFHPESILTENGRQIVDHFIRRMH